MKKILICLLIFSQIVLYSQKSDAVKQFVPRFETYISHAIVKQLGPDVEVIDASSKDTVYSRKRPPLHEDLYVCKLDDDIMIDVVYKYGFYSSLTIFVKEETPLLLSKQKQKRSDRLKKKVDKLKKQTLNDPGNARYMKKVKKLQELTRKTTKEKITGYYFHKLCFWKTSIFDTYIHEDHLMKESNIEDDTFLKYKKYTENLLEIIDLEIRIRNKVDQEK